MKVLHVSDSYPGLHRIWGGAEMGCKYFLETLDGCVEQALATSIPDFEDGKDSIPCEHFTIKKGKKKSRIFAPFNLLATDMVALKNFNSLLDCFKPDVVHFHRIAHLSMGLIQLPQKKGIKSVLSLYDCGLFCPKETLTKPDGNFCHEMAGAACAECIRKDFTLPIRKFLWKLRGKKIRVLAESLSNITVLSPAWLNMLYQFGIEEAKCKVLPLPLKNIPEENSVSHKTVPGRIFFAGWFQKRKGFAVLLEAFNILKKDIPEAHLIAVNTKSDEEYYQAVIKRIKKLKLEEYVEIRGRMPQEKLHDLMLSAEVVAIPEQWPNPFPVVLTEAMSFAKKIIASDIGGIPGLLGNNEERGFLAVNNKPDEWACKLKMALQPNDSTEGMRKRGREYIINHCSPEKVLASLLEYYK